jgi:hypothetical protein
MEPRMTVPKLLIVLVVSLFALCALPGYAQGTAAQRLAEHEQYDADVLTLQEQRQKFPGFVDAYHKYSRYSGRPDVGQISEGSQFSRVSLARPHQFKFKKDGGSDVVRLCAGGHCDASGNFIWDGRAGHIAGQGLSMPGATVRLDFKDSGYVGVTRSMLKVIGGNNQQRTTPITNAEFAMIMAARSQLVNEMSASPDREKESMRAAQEIKQATAADQLAQSAEANQQSAYLALKQPLINVANENCAVPVQSRAAYKSHSQVVWMVQQMYKQVFVPMAYLLLLPGAILTQFKSSTAFGILNVLEDDTASPFSGLFKTLIALFLIPATQLFLSYAVDVGDALTGTVAGGVNIELITKWAGEQTFNTGNQHDNHIKNKPEQGKAFDMLERSTSFERQNYLSSTGTYWFNMLNNALGEGVLVLNAFQLVMICYLLLMGPIAAALFAWPAIAHRSFVRAFSSWIDGVVVLSLWKFWWSVVLLCVTVRLQYLQEMPLARPPSDMFEMFMLAAFMGILLAIPFNPFDFHPGTVITTLIDITEQQTGSDGPSSASQGAGKRGRGGKKKKSRLGQ